MQIRWSMGADCSSHTTRIRSAGAEVGSVEQTCRAFDAVGGIGRGRYDSGEAKTGSMSGSIVFGDIGTSDAVNRVAFPSLELLRDAGVGEAGSYPTDEEEEDEVEEALDEDRRLRCRSCGDAEESPLRTLA